MAAFWVLVAVAAAAALADWVAVATGRRGLEYAAKPTVLAALCAAAALVPADRTVLADRQIWFVAALALCLVGDVLLMLPADLFVAGLGAFLVGHLLFIGGFLQPPVPSGVPPFSFSALGLVVATVVLVAAEAAPLTAILRSLLTSGHRGLVLPVCAYTGAIATMFVLGVNVGIGTAAAGATLFVVSDSLLAFDRFVRPIPRGPLAVHATYHAAQALLVLSLLR